MKRTVNFSGRKRILADDFHLIFRENKGSAAGHNVEIAWDLTQLELPSDSQLFLECAGRGQFYRFNLGEVGVGIGEASKPLGSVRDLSSIRAEVFVTAADGQVSRILASSAPVSVALGEDSTSTSKSILALRVEPRLEVMWRVNYSEGMPVLEVSQRFGSVHSEDWFFPTVLPAVVREIYINVSLGIFEMEDESIQDWVTYFEGLGFKIAAVVADPDSIDAGQLTTVFNAADDLARKFSENFNYQVGEANE